MDFEPTSPEDPMLDECSDMRKWGDNTYTTKKEWEEVEAWHKEMEKEKIKFDKEIANDKARWMEEDRKEYGDEYV